MKWVSQKKGFTVVELLIVVVAIAILAAITIVSFNGIQSRSKAASLQADLANAAKTLELFKTQSSTETYPDTLAAANLNASPGTTYEYSADAISKPATFCLVALNGSQKYSVASGSPVSTSTCAANIATNPSFETDTSGWFNSPGAAIVRTSVRASHGQFAGAATSTGSGTDRYVYAQVPVTRVGTASVSAKVYLEAGAATDFSRGLWVNNTPASTWSLVSYNTSTLNSWQSVSTSYDIPNGSTGLWVRFYVMPGYTIYIDDLKVTVQ